MATPQLRFKEFDGDWSLSSLSKISSIITGNTPSTSNREYYDGEFLFVSPADIQENRYIEKTKTTLTANGFSKCRHIPENSVLFVCIGSTIGKVAQNKVICATNQQINAVIPQKGYSSDFLYLQLERLAPNIKLNAGVQAVPLINKTEFGKTLLNTPVYIEQTKIASFLSAVDEKISQLTQKHELLSQYKQGMMQKLFSQQIRFKADDGSEFGEWEEKKLGDICLHFQSGKTITSASISENGEYPVYGGNGLRGYTNTYTHDGIYALIGRQGALCGNINLVTGKNFISEHAIAVQTKKDSSTEWLSRWLDFMQLNRFSESSAQAGLAVNKLVKFDIFVPCLEEQTKIANFLSAIDQKIEVVAQQIEQAKQWKKGLLQQMFV